MGFLGAAIVIAGVGLVVYLIKKGSASGNRPRNGARRGRIDYTSAGVPSQLGIRSHLKLEALERRLNKAFSPSFQEKLKMRHLQARPAMSDAEYEWKLFELKRYFIMCSVMRNVPMFSAAVDEIWHDMLMFTREYQHFCDELIGATIHHAPHTGVQPMPGERAWFDWMYSQLFEPALFSGHIWNAFFRHPMPKPLLEQFRQETKEQLAGSFFNRDAAGKYPEIEEAIGQLIDLTKEHVRQAYDRSANNTEESYDHREHSRSSYGATDPMMIMAGSMLLYSMMDDGAFEERMQLQAEEQELRNDGSSGGAACGYASSCSSDGSNGDSSDGGGDSGGSSCSSSSCGSGCGGGGD